MSGVGFSELIILFLIGLIVLGPERLPRVANQLGTWLGQARRMTRVMKRQLEEELNFDSNPHSIRPSSTPHRPRDDDNYSPLHKPELTPEDAAEMEAETAQAARDTEAEIAARATKSAEVPAENDGKPEEAAPAQDADAAAGSNEKGA